MGGKRYDGKKRWNETILATTSRASASGGRSHAPKKRLSGRTHKLSAAMRRVDEDTRLEVRNARLDALEADNFGEDADETEEDAYVDEEDGMTVGREAMTAGRDHSRRRRSRAAAASRKKWKVKSLQQLVFEELGNGEAAEGPNYLTAAAGPPKCPARRFCCVCGYFATYSCRRCGSRYCSVGCGDHHKESGCMKFGL